MKQPLIHFILCWIVLSALSALQAQDLKNIKADRFFSGSLTKVLDELAKEHSLKFSFDREALAKMPVDDRPFNESLDVFLNNLCKPHKLKYALHEGTIYVMQKTSNLEQVLRTQVGKVDTKTNLPTRTNLTVTGKVRDAQTGEALPFSTVGIKGTTQGVSTNADGYFVLQKVPSDTATLIANFIGYREAVVRLLPNLPTDNISIDLAPTTNELTAVTLSGEREDMMSTQRTDISVVRLTPKTLERLPNVGEKDIMRSFQLMPGISASNESSSGLYVRGGTPDQNLIVYDGFTVYHVDHLYGFFSAFNANALKDVQLHKGGFESRFGGRLASVTEITGKDGNQKQFNVGGDLSLLSFNVFAEMPIGDKFSSVFAFRRSYKSPLYQSLFKRFNENDQNNSQNNTQNTPFAQNTTQARSYFYDLNGKLTYRFSNNHSLAWSIYNGTDKLDNGYKVETPSFLASRGISLDFGINDLTNYGNLGSSLKWTQRWSPKFYGSALVSYSNYYSNRDRSNNGTITSSNGEQRTIKFGTLEDNNLKDYSLKTDYQWDYLPNNQLQFGNMHTNYDIKYTYSQNDTTTVIDKDDKGYTSSVYLQNRTKLFNNRLQFVAGLRANYFNITDQWYYEPRFSATYNVTKRLTLKGAWGNYYQFANRIVREDILAGSRDFWLLSNGTNIPVSNSQHYIAGLAYETPQYLFSVEGYHKDLSGLSEYSLRFTPSSQGIKYDENFYNGTGFAQGIEFLAQKKGGKVNGWVGYTLGKVRHKFDVYSKDFFPAQNDVTHEFKAVGIYQHKRFDASITWIYATGRPYTAPSGAYNISLLDGTTESYFSISDKNSLRLPHYHRLDVAFNYRLFSKGNDIGYIGLSLFNLYNRTNVWYKQFEIIENSIVTTNINYLGITPNLTLSLKLR